MTTQPIDYRLDGIYRQRQEGFFMQRVKLPAGVFSAEQARAIADVSSRFGQGAIHLTTRGSIEIHWLLEGDLIEVKRVLAKVGLTSRGACGGAVRGITCSSQGAAEFPALEAMARRLHRHFVGNPRFERLPKKFKIGVEADTASRRHLIQDVGLVFAGSDTDGTRFDVYLGGGLGREPQAGFLYEAAVNEKRIIPLIEAVARVYAANTPAGKRVKHLIREIGEPEFRRRLTLEPSFNEELPAQAGLPEGLTPAAANRRLEARFFGGVLSAELLAELADFAAAWSGGLLMATADQDIAFHIADTVNLADAAEALKLAGFALDATTFRVCPGAHLCKVGLSPTRDVARTISAAMGPAAKQLTWALSGCPNSCTQPQLAEIGIVSSSLVKDEQGERTPRFDLYRPNSEGLGSAFEHSLTLDELCSKVREIG
ncbi:MAG: nitrite/sulfite reductase [Deltaproteobacteria bacterium]|nr:nitrite/sulfite reductase [Deltaproteobacteria bacterium]